MRATGKPFTIDKKQVYEAYKAVKSKGGAAGEDGQTIEQFEADLKNNLYKIWNRMSSGTYFPPPVRAVSIPKKSGGQRILGVPTVADRVAQMVVKQVIEPDLDPVFLPDSYGYRPRKSALDAVGVTRERCWKYDWVLEFDIRPVRQYRPRAFAAGCPEPRDVHMGAALHRTMADSADGAGG
jgi:RNA-directed DNA polymerase